VCLSPTSGRERFRARSTLSAARVVEARAILPGFSLPRRRTAHALDIPRWPHETRSAFVDPASYDMRLALLEDDPTESETLSRWLEQAGHACHVFSSGRALVRTLGRESFDLLLLDWVLPDLNGDRVLEWVRTQGKLQLPVIFVTSRASEASIVEALDRGADDYLAKPVRRAELIARVNALLRRTGGAARADVLSCPPYHFDPATRRATLNDAPVELTDKEFELALFLFTNLGRVVSRGHILERVWGRAPDIATRTVDSHVSRLRGKLAISPDNGLRLSAVYSYGYRLEQIEL